MKTHDPATADLLRYFGWEHLPPQLQPISKPFGELAREMAERLDGPELTAGLRKLLEAKDCCVRAAMPARLGAVSQTQDIRGDVPPRLAPVGVQINGKTVGTVLLSPDASEDVAVGVARADSVVARRLEGEAVTGVVYKQGRLLNLITR